MSMPRSVSCTSTSHAPAVRRRRAGALERLAATDGLTGLAAPGRHTRRPHVTDTITVDDHPPIALRRHVLAFFQGNRYLLNQLAAHVVAQVPPGGDVIDLYAGVGVFAMAAAAIRGARVTAVEGDRIAAADLAANAAATDGAVSPLHQSVERFLAVQSRSRAGPARPGALSSSIHRAPACRAKRSTASAGRGASRIVYVSCDVATLARDARRLLVDGGYTLAQVDAFDLFPNTPHTWRR